MLRVKCTWVFKSKRWGQGVIEGARCRALGAGPEVQGRGLQGSGREGAGFVWTCGYEPAASPSWSGGGTGLVCVKFQRIGGRTLLGGVRASFDLGWGNCISWRGALKCQAKPGKGNGQAFRAGTVRVTHPARLRRLEACGARRAGVESRGGRDTTAAGKCQSAAPSQRRRSTRPRPPGPRGAPPGSPLQEEGRE